tara:strand:+ start:564 stop:755 length:192 start_codon:yes stop_codon:yes gene_type:complete
MKDWFFKFLHNAIAHPLLCFLPSKLGNSFHDWTAKFMKKDYVVTWDHKSDTIMLNGNVKGRGE